MSISYEEFSKIHLVVAKVLSADRVEGSEKLIKIKLDAGDKDSDVGVTTRQIVAGIGKSYQPEELVGRQIVIVENLEPRQLMGFESQGMLLAADSVNGPVLLMPDSEVLPGSRVK